MENEKALKGFIVSQLSTNERDLFYRKFLTNDLIQEDLSLETISMLNKLRNEVDLVVDHLAGETLAVHLDVDGKLKSNITTGKSRYIYISDHINETDNCIVGSNYEELMLDIIGLWKDGDLNIAEIWSRKNWNFATGDHCFDEHTLNWKVSSSVSDDAYPIIEASDKEELDRIIDCDEVENYIAMLSSAVVVPENKPEGTGKNSVIVQDRLTGLVTIKIFDEIEEVIDLILNNVLIDLERGFDGNYKK